MTALPTLPTLNDMLAPAEPVVRPPRKIREVATDSIVKAGRLATPQAVQDQRTTKRMSVSELNATDMPTLMERYQATEYDDRGPITRFLDLLDLPRNLLVSTVFPNIRRRKEAEGDTGTLGLGNVRFSDVLDELGVGPGIIRGAVGFIGDLALDPLTYAGPAGWGAKVVGKGGKSVELAATGRRALNDAVKMAARGRPIADDAAAEIVKTFGEGVIGKAGLTTKQVEDDLRNAIYGAKSGGGLSRVTEALGADIGTQGSALADEFFSAVKTPRSEAARKFVAKHGRGAAKGVRLGVKEGEAGSYLAHIPFTSYGLFVPAFTGAAKEAGVIAARATAGFRSASGPIGDDVALLDDLRKQSRSITDELRSLKDDLDEAFESGEEGSVAAIQEAIDGLNERRRGITDRAEKIFRSTDPEGLTGGLYEGVNPSRPQNALDSIADVVHQEGQYRDLVDDSLDFENQMRETVETVNKRRQIVNAIAPELRAKTDEIYEAMRGEHEAQFGEGGMFRREKPVAPEMPTPEQAFQYEKDLAEWEATHLFDGKAARNRARRMAMGEITPNLKEGQKALLNIDPVEMDLMESIADSIQTEMKVRSSQASAIRGTIQQAATQTKNRMLADVAADMIGLGPTTGGYSAFTPFRTATRAVFGDDHTLSQYANRKFDALDEWTRKMFGMSNGEAGRVRRQFEATRDVRAKAAYNQKLNTLKTEVEDALSASGVDPKHWEEAQELTMALAISERAKAGENWSLHGSPMLTMLEAAKNGPLAPAQTNLLEIARRNLDLLDGMTQDELVLKLLGENTIEGYMSGGATREGAAFLQGLGNDAAEQARKASTAATQPFQREKNMTRAVFNGPTGEINSLYKWEHNFFRSFTDDAGRLTPSGFDRLRSMGEMHPDVAGYNEKFWDLVASGDHAAAGEMVGRLTPWEKMAYLSYYYDQLPGSMRIGAASFRQVDPFMLNQEFANRLGVFIPGRVTPRGMFETSFAEQLANRTAYHEKAKLAAQFNEVLGQHASSMSRQIENQAILKIQAGADSAEIKFANGARGRIERSPSGEYVVRIGDSKYRKIRGMDDVQAAMNDLGAGVYDPSGLVKYFPEKVAEAYERVADVVNTKKHEFLGMYDEFLRVWKSFTLAHPSWILGDVAGATVQALAAGVNPMKFGRSVKDAMRLAMAADNPDALKAIKVVIGGREMDGVEAMKTLNRYSIPSGMVHGEAFAKLVEGGVYLPEYTNRILSSQTLKDPIGAIKTRVRDIRTRAAMKAKITTDAMKISDPLKARATKALSAYNAVVPEGFVRNVLSPFMAMNARANDTMRIASFMALMDDGHDAAGAAAKVLESMFDVGDLTKFETEFMKRIIPFYSWMKHSGVYWTRRLLQNPALANMAPRVKSAIEEGLYGDDSIPDHLRPNWMRDQLALQIGSDPQRRYAFTLGTLIPQETALSVGAAATSPLIGVAGLKHLLEQVGFGLTLPIKAVIEGAAGREMFSGRTIGFNPNEGDLSVGEYLAGQVRPLRELGVGNIRQGPIQKAASAGVVPLASRVLVGGRAQPFDDDRIRQNKVRSFKEAEQNIRKRITIAEREGAAGVSVDARATLMRLYDLMVQRGLEDEVPAWARLQLEELHQNP